MQRVTDAAPGHLVAIRLADVPYSWDGTGWGLVIGAVSLVLAL